MPNVRAPMHEGSYTLVTGASSGMGAATAVLLSRTRNLILCGRDETRLGETAEECMAAGADVRLFPFDLEKADTVKQKLADLLLGEGLQVEAFAHFAGMTEVLPISRTNYSLGLRVMNVNYFSAVEMICCLLKKKINSNALQAILLVSSIVVYGGKRYQPHYCASKGAIIALGRALAAELAPTVRVNVISPGSFRTRMVETLFHDPEAAWNPPTLLPPGDVQEIAKTSHFLLSDDASYLTGQVLDVDGGEHFPRLG